MFTTLTIGEALVEIMRPDRDQPLDRPGEFLGPFASGAPAIFAVAAARLGMRSAFIGAVGNDAFGRLLQTRLTTENVDVTGLRMVPGRSTGTAFVGYANDGRRTFVFHLRHSASRAIDVRRLPAGFFSGIRWLHLSGSALALGAAARSACRTALDLTLAAGGRLSLDPNLRPELMSLKKARQVLAPYLDAATLLLPTAEEAHMLTGAADDDLAAAHLLAKQERLVVFKRGAAGCTVFSQQDRLDVPGFRVSEIDPTGAGDCFNAAFILGLTSGWHLQSIARFANAAGALAVTKQGPMAGAPTLSEVQAMLAQAELI